jgi:N-acetylneuraminic acid mutarotase
MRLALTLGLLCAALGPARALDWQPVADLPSARAGQACAAIGARALYVGGAWRSAGGDWTLAGDVSVFAPEPGAWQSPGALPYPLAQAAAASVGDRLYVMSGTDGRRVLADTLICLPWRGTWQWLRGPDLPEARLQAAAASIGRDLYLVGGCPGPDLQGKLSNGVLRLSTTDKPGAWKPVRRFPGAGRAQMAAAACGGKLYVFGGVVREGADLVASDDAFVYDPARDRWDRLPDLPCAGRQWAAAGSAGRILILGGRQTPPATAETSEYVSDRVFSFDPATRTYAEAGTLPLPLARLGTVSLPDGRVLIAGGETASGQPSSLAAIGLPR